MDSAVINATATVVLIAEVWSRSNLPGSAVVRLSPVFPQPVQLRLDSPIPSSRAIAAIGRPDDRTKATASALNFRRELPALLSHRDSLRQAQPGRSGFHHTGGGSATIRDHGARASRLHPPPRPRPATAASGPLAYSTTHQEQVYTWRCGGVAYVRSIKIVSSTSRTTCRGCLDE